MTVEKIIKKAKRTAHKLAVVARTVKVPPEAMDAIQDARAAIFTLVGIVEGQE